MNNLRYLFTAVFKDGSVIEQTQEDKSSVREDKNAFYDVLQRMDELIGFAFYNQEDGSEYLVDLRDGRFEINGASFYMHDETIHNIRLIYFKRNKILIVNSVTQPPEYEYHFGFQANLENGQNIQKTMILR